MKRFYLALKREKLQKSIYPLEGSVSIGRSPENDITLVDYNVSRTHARVSFQQGSWIIEDCGSANGIIFAGERVVSKTLTLGDSFQIGESILTFMEEGVSDNTEQMSETMQVFSSLINYQSPLVDPNRTNPSFMRLHGALLSTPIFRSLGKKELRGLEDIANLHLFSGGELVFQEGDPGRSVYIILDGGVQVFTQDHQGKDFPLATLESNQFFGEMALLSGKPRSSSVATATESLLAEFSYKNMKRLMMRYPQIKEVLVQYFREREEDSKKKRSKANIQERRKEPRFKERLLVSFGVWPLESLPEEMISHTYKATSEDISISGIMLVAMGPAMEAFHAGCRLQLEIHLPSHFGRVETQGLVRHVVPEENTVKLGVDFVDTPAEDKKKLQKFLYGQTQDIE
ncbi:MAG: cyclic nucleotide-binding domain-containing protein [Deltaproteobacteria bacterium]|nr:cyclic nucleotide-binding domain-containing protein [Deltaproteobacteria bacterium]